MSRSQWKGNFIDKSLYKNFSKKKNNSGFQSSIDTTSYSSAITNNTNNTNSRKTINKTTNNSKKVQNASKNLANEAAALIKINSRRSTILKPFIGKEVWIYNGQSYIKRKITETMVGHKFGEFAYTRKRYIYKKKNAAKGGLRSGRKGN